MPFCNDIIMMLVLTRCENDALFILLIITIYIGILFVFENSHYIPQIVSICVLLIMEGRLI